jgi:hypothetical protein
VRTPAYRLAPRRLVVEPKVDLADLMGRYEPFLAGIDEDETPDPALVEHLRAKLEAYWRTLPDPGTVIEIPVVPMGHEACSFHPYTGSEPHHATMDPVNLVFFGNAGADRVARLLQSLDPPWIDSSIVKGTSLRAPLCALRHVVWMERAPTGPEGGFVRSQYSLSPQGCDLKRIHLRLFEGTADPGDKGWGRWCLGSVHEEDVLPGRLEHTVTDWDGAQRKVARALLDALGDRCHAVAMRLQPPGEVLRGVPHDGLASAIRLD